MIRSNHYEVAFEAYLRERRVGFIAIDEAKRSILGKQNIKSADFIIVGPDTSRPTVPSSAALKPRSRSAVVSV